LRRRGTARPGRLGLPAFGAVLFWCAASGVAAGQQPFAVDDAEVTPDGVWHLEVSSQLDGLRRPVRPIRVQNALDVEVVAGLGAGLEVGLVVPLITLIARHRGAWHETSGLGDASLGAKVRLTADPSARHAFAVAMAVEFPSGDRDRQLGTGLVDYGVALASQHRLDGRWTARLNAGAVLAGNTRTGVVGLGERGTVLSAGGSLVRQWGGGQIGGELVAAWSQKAVVGATVAAAQIGGNWPIASRATVDLALGTGWGASSPRWSLQLGVSADVIRR